MAGTGGTLVHHAGSGLHTLELAAGDAISSDQMKHAFFTSVGHVEERTDWSLRPQSDGQVNTMLEIDGEVPIVDPNAPFRGVDLQLLSEGLAYGSRQSLFISSSRNTVA